MLILPIHQKLDWKHPPLITLLLLAANILIFAIYQLDDEEETIRAFSYYAESGLATIELPHYKAYLAGQGENELLDELRDADPDAEPWWLFEIQTDSEFQRRLKALEVITPTSPEFAKWREKRREFDRLYESITYVGHGLRTAEPSLSTLFSHMFLHGGFGHLFGNAIFLLAVGLLVEATMGRSTFLLCYLLGGLGSVSFDFLFRPDSLVPGIGASGAIAGLMGAYAVLYGLKRIRFFFFIGVYFDYVRMPALVLLPLWIGNELLQMRLNPDSNVNFLAHLGGLVSGALIATVVRFADKSFTLEHVEKAEKEEALAQSLERARTLCTNMDFDRARPLLKRLRSEHPENREVLFLLHAATRAYPASDEYHEACRAILALQGNDAGTNKAVLETFREYLQRAKPNMRLAPSLMCQLAHRFVQQGATAEADKLLRFIVVKKLPCQGLDTLLARMAHRLQERGEHELERRYRKLALQLAEASA